MLVGVIVAGDFVAHTYDFVKYNEGIRYKVYLDQVAVPSIGIGYPLLQDIGKGGNHNYVYILPTLEADFAGIHKFSDAELNLLGEIANDLNAGNQAAARTLFNSRMTGVLRFQITDPNALALYRVASARNVNDAIPPDILKALSNTYELTALYSLAYNCPACANSSPLLSDIRTGNRPDA